MKRNNVCFVDSKIAFAACQHIKHDWFSYFLLLQGFIKSWLEMSYGKFKDLTGYFYVLISQWQ